MCIGSRKSVKVSFLGLSYFWSKKHSFLHCSKCRNRLHRPFSKTKIWFSSFKALSAKCLIDLFLQDLHHHYLDLHYWCQAQSSACLVKRLKVYWSFLKILKILKNSVLMVFLKFLKMLKSLDSHPNLFCYDQLTFYI